MQTAELLQAPVASSPDDVVRVAMLARSSEQQRQARQSAEAGVIVAIGDRGYDADWFSGCALGKGRPALHPGRRRPRNEPVRHDQRRYRRRSHIEIMFDLRRTGMVAPMVLDGQINRDAFHAYVGEVLVPSYAPATS